MIILPLILTLTLSSCNKEKDPNYPESITIEASDATPELKEISTQLKDFEKTYENFYSETTTEEQKNNNPKNSRTHYKSRIRNQNHDRNYAYR